MSCLVPICLALVVASPEAVAEGEQRTERPPAAAERPPIAPGLQEVFAAWESRDKAIGTFDLSFRIERKSQSSSFGALGSVGSAAIPTFRLRSDGTRVRFDGFGHPSIEVGGSPIDLATLFKKPTGSDEEYLEALWSGFEQPTVPEPRQPYVAIQERDRVTHFWDQLQTAYPRALVLPSTAVQERTLTERHAIGLPLVADAALIALRLSASLDPPQPRRCVRLSEPAVLKGVPCVVVVEILQRKEPKQIRRNWLDPARGFLPLRVLELEEDVARRDYVFEYDEASNGTWVPSKWTVVSLHEYGGVDEFTTAVRTKWNANPKSPQDTFDLTFPPGTWIVDLDRGRQSLVAVTGERRLDFSETAGNATYADLVYEGVVSVSLTRVQSLAPRLISWPWLVVTLPMLWIVVQITLSRVRAVARRRRSTSKQDLSEPVHMTVPDHGGDD
jgi:hypothetical protein